MSDLSNKVMLTIATTGAYPVKKHNPAVPLDPPEIAEDILACAEAGASICHIHVRDDEHKASMSFDKFKEVVDAVRPYSNIVINLTTSGGTGWPDDVRMKPFQVLHPEVASFDCGTMNWQRTGIFENHPKFLEKLGTEMQKHDVKPEIEVFDPGMIYNALDLQKRGFLKPGPLHFQIVMGVKGGIDATVDNLVWMHSLLPKDATWGAVGIGHGQMPIMLATLAMGGHLRVGMEDNVMMKKGVLAKNNVEFVKRAIDLIHLSGKEVATPDEAREILGVENKTKIALGK
jgi:3-keto-5-aminohexanoate cleavage enzyme